MNTDSEQPWSPPTTKQTEAPVKPRPKTGRRAKRSYNGIKLTDKQKAFADALLNNPQASAAQAAEETYNIENKHIAEVIGSENLKKPEIIRYLQQNASEAELVMLDIMRTSQKYAKTGSREGAAYASVGVSAAKDILDRVHGKATQRTELISKKVSVTIDLTGQATSSE
jgi:phage terminase small subunit